jgi:CheY-like chemotaxis protein/anti-sigma regulatory factor (Ser/Thr protein kinase)
VDDWAVDRQLAGMLLEKELDCTVRYAADGKEALRQMAEELPDLVVSDLQMPEMNGLELVAAVKNDYPLVPIILMTAQGSEEIAAEALRQGAASYVPKRRLADDLAATALRVLLGSLEERTDPHLMHYLETSESVFVVPNDLGLLRSLIKLQQQTLRCLPLGDETERLRVGIALEEALLNAYYHGNLEVARSLGKATREAREQLAQERLQQEPYRDRRIRVLARISRTEAVFVIRDEGPGFDVARLPSGAQLPDTEDGVGRGIVLMRSIMDEVAYNDAGNEVTLVKRRAPEPPSEQWRD